MVRINLIEPRRLTDQHLIAEYNEILMLLGYVSKFPKLESTPSKFTLGKGHIKFFKNKLQFLKERHEEIKEEMVIRGFNPTKNINLTKFPVNLINTWKPVEEDLDIIKNRIIEKIKLKPNNFYRYYGKYETEDKLINLIKEDF